MTRIPTGSLLACIAGTGLIMATPAYAGSDYLLELEGVDGTSTPMPLESWSFGASNPTSVGSSGMSAGRMHHAMPMPEPMATNGTVRVVTGREAGSGMATGRSACPTGTHFPKANLTHAGKRWQLSDVTISDCGAGGMTLAYAAATVVKSKSNITNN